MAAVTVGESQSVPIVFQAVMSIQVNKFELLPPRCEVFFFLFLLLFFLFKAWKINRITSYLPSFRPSARGPSDAK